MSKKNKAKQAPSPRSQVQNSRLDLRWAYIFLFIVAVGLYLNTLSHEFAFDDSVVITGNKYTMQGFEGIKTLATKDLFYGIYGTSLDLEGGRWRPLTLVMFAIEYGIFGDNPTPYHVTNVLLYGITALVLFMTLLQIFSAFSRGRVVGGELLAFITTLLFIAHPIHTEVVANIKSRDEIVSFLFLCLTLLNVFKSVQTDTKKYLLFGVLCFFTALLSKESGITFVAIIPLALFCFAGRSVRQSLITTIPFLVTAGIYLGIRTSLVGMIGDRESNDITDNPFLQVNFPALPTPIPAISKLATVCWILLKYLLLLVFPHPLTSDYGFNEIPAINFADPKAIASIVIYGVLLVYAVRILLAEIKARNEQGTAPASPVSLVLAFCIIYFVATISIVSNLFFLIGTTMGERFAYISSMGFCLALAVLAIKVLKLDASVMQDPSLAAKKLMPLLVILVPYSFKTISRNPAWKNNKELFTADVQTSTGSANAHYYYANTLFGEHMNDKEGPSRDSLFYAAMTEFRKGMQINPYFHYCYYNIGLIWEKLGKPDSAIYYQQKTIDLQPVNTMAQYMAKGALGLVYGKLKGDFAKAIPLLKEALAYKPDDPGYHENLGICYAYTGNHDGAIEQFEWSVHHKKKFTKDDARIFVNLSLAWHTKDPNGTKDEEYFEQARALDPDVKRQW